MRESYPVESVRNVGPAGVVGWIVFILTVLIIFTLPVAELQPFFWAIAVGGFLIGDSVTTGYLGEFGLQEQDRGYTRWACGAEPTLRCAFITRLLAFGAVFGVYYVGISYPPVWEYTLARLSVLMLPVIFGLMGVGATVANVYGMWRARRAQKTTR